MRRLAFGVLAAVSAGWANAPLVAQPAIALGPGEALLSVQADGFARTRPDMMAINAGTVTTGTTAAEAVAANAALAQRLIAAVRGLGIEPRDIRTTSFSVNSQFEGDRERPSADGRPPRITGYVVNNTVHVRLRELGNAERLIARLFEAGANSVRGPFFGLNDDRAARRAAERDAIAQARAEAENYAAAAGRRVGRLLRISERRTWTDNDGEAIVVTGSRMPATPIEPGEIETRVTVFVDFALAPE